MHQQDVVGTVTSGDWGYRTRLNLAYAFVDTRFAGRWQPQVEIDMCGQRIAATVIAPSPYDPQMSRVRT